MSLTRLCYELSLFLHIYKAFQGYLSLVLHLSEIRGLLGVAFRLREVAPEAHILRASLGRDPQHA